MEEIVPRAESGGEEEEEGENNGDVQDELKKSTSHLLGLLGPAHPGRPHTEEPHVKKTMKNKKERIELICRVDQDQLGLQEDDYDDLKALFELFDYDQDGVVSMKEGMGMLSCVGFPVDEPNVSHHPQSSTVSDVDVLTDDSNGGLSRSGQDWFLALFQRVPHSRLSQEEGGTQGAKSSQFI